MSKNTKYGERFNTELATALWPKVSELGNNDKYEITLTWEKGSKGAKQIMAEFKKSMDDAYPGGKPDNFAHMPLKDGDEKTWVNPETSETEVRAGFENKLYIVAKSDRKPFLVDPSGKNAADPESLTHGSHVIVNVNTYSWSYKATVGLSFGLNSVQVSGQKTDLPGGGFTDPMSTFENLGGEEDSPSGGETEDDDELNALFG